MKLGGTGRKFWRTGSIRWWLLVVVVLSLPGCGQAPKQAWSGQDDLIKSSPNGQLIVEIIPPAEVPVQRIHSWAVRVTDAAGKPLDGALVYVNGGMPEHGHGMPTRPQVTRELSPGVYEVLGMKFNMTGDWEILVAVQKGPVSDVTAFRYKVR